MILGCTCMDYKGNTQAIKFLDETYGESKRPHNPMATPEMWRCVVCNSERKAGKKLSKAEEKALKRAEAAEKQKKESPSGSKRGGK